MLRKICMSSVSVFVLLGFLGSPDISFAMEQEEANQPPTKRRKVDEDRGHDDTEQNAFSALPSEMCLYFFDTCDPCTQAVLRGVCQEWKRYVDGEPTIDLLGKFNRTQDRVDELERRAKSAAGPEVREELEKARTEVGELLKKGNPSKTLFRLLQNGLQEHLIYNQDRYIPFLRQAIAQDPISPLFGMRYLADNYPRVFHAYHPYLLEELWEASERFEKSDKVPFNWGEDLLFLLDETRINYLLEVRNRPVFTKLAPYFVRAYKDRDLLHQDLIDLSEDFPKAYEVLLPSFIELVKSPEDFKKNFFFISEDPLTFACLLPALANLIKGSSDLQNTFREMMKGVLLDISDQPETASAQLNEIIGSAEGSKKLKKCLGVISLLAHYGDKQFQISLGRFLNILPRVDGPERALNYDDPYDNPAFNKYCCRMDKLPLYGHPFWGAYYIGETHWRTQAEIYTPMSAEGANIKHIPRFAMVASKILIHLKKISDYYSKSGENIGLTIQLLNHLLPYQVSLERLKVKIADEHMSNDEEDRACLVYQELQTLPLFDVLKDAFDVYCHHFLFTEAIQLCVRFMNNSDIPPTTLKMLTVKCIDASLHLNNSPENALQLTKLLESILQELGEEETLKASIPNGIGTSYGFISKESISFLKTCFEVLHGSCSVDILLNELFTHMQNINGSFLQVHIQRPEHGEKLYKWETLNHEIMKTLYQQSVLSRVLEVFTQIGYVTLNEETKQNIQSQLKPIFTALASPAVACIDYKTQKLKTILRLSLHRYDSLLLKIFKTDKEADQTYKEVRFLYGIDLREEKKEKEKEKKS